MSVREDAAEKAAHEELGFRPPRHGRAATGDARQDDRETVARV